MNYKETLDFLYSQLPAYQRIGKAAYKANLDNTIVLDDYLGNPHRRFAAIHVAGTNGKGSVSHMLASVLSEAGFKTGLYTSPHLRDFRERIRIDGVMIPEEEVVAFVSEHIEKIMAVSPSFFEMTVALAFDYFARMEVDIAVIETGMGGRLDSTNIITPLLSVITNIGHDHMEFLGDTLEKVAGEKAGIIKPGVPVVIGERSDETAHVFEAAAKKNGSLLSFADSFYECIQSPFSGAEEGRGYTITRLSDSLTMSGVTPLPGDYQSRNLVTLFQAIDSLNIRFRPTNAQLIKGIASTREATGLLGRWQILGHDPLIICDTGHNKEGLVWVMKQLAGMKYEKLHMVIGVVNDKDLSSVLPLFPVEAAYYFTRASIPRALDEKVLEAEAGRYGLSGSSYGDVPSAYRAALCSAGKNDLIFVGGSTFVVAEVV
jgi:dihydrofolate synthase / folylpolyglutamate synthase